MEGFEEHRTYLFSIAYRMLGSAMDAEDMVQETYLRYQATPEETIRSPKAYLTTILTRLCIDQLQLARRKRESYIGPWMPEPILTQDIPDAVDPEKRMELQESISLAFPVLMEQLQPFERAVFLLREVFEYEFPEIATMLDKSESACRRSFSRAKLHLRAERPRFPASLQVHQRLLEAYVQAVQSGDMSCLMDILAEGVVLWADSGGKTKAAALHPIRGRDAVARISMGSRRFWPEHNHIERKQVNGQTALIVVADNQIFSVLAIDVEDEQIQTIRILVNPDKLARLR